MAHAPFVHLRVHTAYSLLEGAIPVKKLAKMCREQAMPAVAMTDTDNLFGALEFSLACADAGVQPIIGCQIGLRLPDSEAPAPVVLLAQTETGYANLCRLLSRAYLETAPGEAAQVPRATLAEHAADLLLLTGGVRGPVGEAAGSDDAAHARLADLKTLFPDRLYVEVQRHGMAAEAALERRFLDLADALDLPLVATNECYFPDPDLYEAHDALRCVAEGRYVAEEDRPRLTPDHCFKSAQDMRTLFSDLPEAVDNTLVIARRCAVMAEKRKPILPPYDTAAGRDEGAELRAQAHAGLERRLETQVWTADQDAAAREEEARPYRERLDHELDIIVQMGFPGYFLIVADFIQWAKTRGIPVGPGRGSGAGSCVAWALTITDLDPLRFGLLFERFLNPERVSMPDFDVDFCQDRRDEVIRYVQDKYGHDKVAQIITFGKLQARAVLRDVGRVLHMPYGQVDRICKMVPNNPANPVTLAEALEGEPALQQAREEDGTVAHMIDIGRKLEGLYRHASTHAAGVVIGDRPLDQLVPLYRDPRSDMPVTQFNMKWVEAAGLVKFDFLGLKTLTVLSTAVALLAERGVALDLETLPLDDKPVFRLLAAAETVGVFQLESSGMRDVLRKLKPDTIEDIIAVVALYRPGPMDNIPRYIAVKHGAEEPDYLHPQLEGILRETYGIMIYQEQVMQIAQVLAGYTLGGADLLRRAMGKKIKEEMDKQRAIFVEGATARGVEEGTAQNIFDQVAKFAGYGFNKSHAAAYALVAYQTAYVKANHPVAFMAASMTLDMHNTDKLAVFKAELDRLGIPLLPPDINRSQVAFAVEETADGTLAVRYALAALKNVGEGAMRALVAAREAHGPFRDVGDVAARLDPHQVNRRSLEMLIRAGALDGLDSNRRQLVAGAETLIRHAQAVANDRDGNQSSLFGGETALPPPRLPEGPDWPAMERLKEEAEAVGFYLSAHPLESYATTLQRLQVVAAGDLLVHVKGGGPKRVKMAGLVGGKREGKSRNGHRFAFLQVSDASAGYEVTMFSETLSTARPLLEVGTPLLLTVDVRLEEGDQMRLTAHQVRHLDEAAAEAAAGLRIHLHHAAPLPALVAAVTQQQRGRATLTVVAHCAEREVEIALAERIRLSPQVLATLKSIPGVGEVREV